MDQPTPIEVSFRLSLKDIQKVYFHTLLRLWLMIPLVLCMISVVALSAWMDRMTHTSYLIPILRFVTVAAALVALSFALPYLLARNTLRTSPLFKSEVRHVFGEAGVETVTSASQSRVDWSGFYRAVEIKDFVLLYMSSRVFYIVPLKSFSSLGQLQAFKSLLQRKMEGKVRLRP